MEDAGASLGDQRAQAAFESCSWAMGQVMGAHWAWFGFGSVTEMVNLCRSGAGGQIDVMARYIDKAGLAGAFRARDWRTFAKGYNGQGYAKNANHTKMAAALNTSEAVSWSGSTATYSVGASAP